MFLGEDPQYQAIAEGLKSLQKARPVFPKDGADAVRSALAEAFPIGDSRSEALLASLGPSARRDHLQRPQRLHADRHLPGRSV